MKKAEGSVLYSSAHTVLIYDFVRTEKT